MIRVLCDLNSPTDAILRDAQLLSYKYSMTIEVVLGIGAELRIHYEDSPSKIKALGEIIDYVKSLKNNPQSHE